VGAILDLHFSFFNLVLDEETPGLDMHGPFGAYERPI